jgi:hypothetical protein
LLPSKETTVSALRSKYLPPNHELLSLTAAASLPALQKAESKLVLGNQYLKRWLRRITPRG